MDGVVAFFFSLGLAMNGGPASDDAARSNADSPIPERPVMVAKQTAPSPNAEAKLEQRHERVTRRIHATNQWLHQLRQRARLEAQFRTQDHRVAGAWPRDRRTTEPTPPTGAARKAPQQHTPEQPV